MVRKRRSSRSRPAAVVPAARQREPKGADQPVAGPGPLTSPSGRWAPLAGAIIVAVAALAYANSFGGPFVFDGQESITDNPYIRRLWPITEAIKAPPQATTSGPPRGWLWRAVN